MYPICRHIKTSGTKCGAPALKGRAYCYFHFNANKIRYRSTADRMEAFMNPKFKVDFLEDRAAIQAAISETVHALAQDHMDHKRAGKILWGLQMAMSNLKAPGGIVATEPVRAVFQNEEGQEIGPEQVGYDETDEPLKLEEDELASTGNVPQENQPGHPKAAAPKPPSALRQAITTYLTDLKEKHPNLAADDLIKRMANGLSSIP